MKRFEVIENNGGSLMLAVFDNDGKVEYLHDGYEGSQGDLIADLKALEAGGDPVKDWDGNEDFPQWYYDQGTSFETGWAVVADNDGIYPEKMGCAARREFGIKYE